MDVSDTILQAVELAKQAIRLEDYEKAEKQEQKERAEHQERKQLLERRMNDLFSPDFISLLHGRYQDGRYECRFIFTVKGHEYWMTCYQSSLQLCTQAGEWSSQIDSVCLSTKAAEDRLNVFYRFIARNEPAHEKRDAEKAELEAKSEAEEKAAAKKAELEAKSEAEEKAAANPVPKERAKLVPTTPYFVSGYLSLRELPDLLNDLHEAGYVPLNLDNHDGQFYVVIARRVEDKPLLRQFAMAPEAGQ